MTYNIDEMTLSEMVTFYNALSIEERPNHWLLHLHIVFHPDFDRLYQQM